MANNYNIIIPSEEAKTLSFNNTVTNQQYLVKVTTEDMYSELVDNVNSAYTYTLDELYGTYTYTLNYITNSYNSLYTELAKYKADNNAYVTSLGKTIDTHNEIIKRINTDIEYISNVTGYKLVADDLYNVKNSIIDISEYIDKLTEDHAQYETTFDSLNNKISELNGNIITTNSRLDEINLEDLIQLANDVSGLRNAIDSIGDKQIAYITYFTERINNIYDLELKQHIDEIYEDISTIEDEIENSINTKLDDLYNEHIVNLNSYITSYSGELTNLGITTYSYIDNVKTSIIETYTYASNISVQHNADLTSVYNRITETSTDLITYITEQDTKLQNKIDDHNTQLENIHSNINSIVENENKLWGEIDNVRETTEDTHNTIRNDLTNAIRDYTAELQDRISTLNEDINTINVEGTAEHLNSIDDGIEDIRWKYKILKNDINILGGNLPAAWTRLEYASGNNTDDATNVGTIYYTGTPDFDNVNISAEERVNEKIDEVNNNIKTLQYSISAIQDILERVIIVEDNTKIPYNINTDSSDSSETISDDSVDIPETQYSIKYNVNEQNNIINPQTTEYEFGNILCGKNTNGEFIIQISPNINIDIIDILYWYGEWENSENAQSNNDFNVTFNITDITQINQYIIYKTNNKEKTESISYSVK